MYGIAGLIRHGGLARDDVPTVVRMTEAEAHRGPDGADYFSD
jgi:asparagine synthetase B (glutamine-hydrolysing)